MGIEAPPRDVTRPIGEWNESRIVASKGKVQHWLNGEKTADYDMNSDEWKAKAKAAAQSFKTTSEVLALIPEVQAARERLAHSVVLAQFFCCE